MDRMTEKGPDGYYIPANRGTFGVSVDVFNLGEENPNLGNTKFTGSAVNKLGLYEDSGLSPDDVLEIAEAWRNQGVELESLRKRYQELLKRKS